MIRLAASLRTWATPAFETTLKAEIAALGLAQLPLQQGLSQASYASEEDLGVMLLGVSEMPDSLRVRVGIFYTGIIPGCHCADDPGPDNTHAEYCELQFDIDRASAEAVVKLLSD